MQRRTLNWMLRQEQSSQAKQDCSSLVNGMYRHIEGVMVPSGTTVPFFIHRVSGQLQFEPPAPPSHLPGGAHCVVCAPWPAFYLIFAVPRKLLLLMSMHGSLA